MALSFVTSRGVRAVGAGTEGVFTGVRACDWVAGGGGLPVADALPFDLRLLIASSTFARRATALGVLRCCNSVSVRRIQVWPWCSQVRPRADGFGGGPCNGSRHRRHDGKAVAGSAGALAPVGFERQGVLLA